MAPEEVCALLRSEFRGAVLETVVEGVYPYVVIDPAAWREVALFLRNDPRLGFDWLRCISGVDHIEDGRFTIVYDLHATRRPPRAGDMWLAHAEIAIKVRVPRAEPVVASVADIWPAANWHERETFDLLGIRFEGHPDLRRILCCDDWVGHPLRRDYEFPMEYHGIPAVTEFGQTRPQH